MKPIKQFLAELNSLNIKLWADDGKLGCKAPKGVLTPALQQELTARKEELLALLQTQPPLPQVKADPNMRHEPFPLTEVQHAYWIGRQAYFELGNLSTQVYMELENLDFEVARLNQAWQKLIARHEMLRIVVHPDGQQQILRDIPDYKIAVLDLNELDMTTTEQNLAHIRQEMMSHVFQADQWPLFEIRVTRLNGKSRLHLCIDALIMDGWSMNILFEEWSRLYRQPELELKPLGLSFRDYMITVKEIETSNLYERSKKYWLDRLETLPPAPNLPLAQDPKTIKNPRFQTINCRLEAALWQPLQEKAKGYGIQASTLLLAVFAEIVTWWSKTPHFTLNLTLFHRLPLHPQVNEIIGDFTSLILVEVNNQRVDNDTFVNRAKRIQNQLWQDLDHRHFSGMEVIRHLNNQQQHGTTALMPIVFTNVLGIDYGQMESLGEEVYSIGQTSQVYLDHVVMESNHDLILTWNIVEALFPTGLVEDITHSYVTFLEQLATQDDLWTSTNLSLLPATQHEQRLAVNNTQTDISDELLHTLFIKQAQITPHNLAVIAPDRTLTYEELYQRSEQIAVWLQAHEAKPNTLVAVVMEKGWEQVVAVLGILMSGAAYLPIDPDLPTERQHYLLAQGEVKLALTQTTLASHLSWPTGLQYLAVDTPQIPLSCKSPNPINHGHDLAYVIYTSGSTGLPKGVMIDHRGAVNTILDINQRFGVTAADRVLALSALNFDLSVYDIFGLLAVGGAIVMPAPTGRRDPSHWVTLMTQHGVTLWDTVPALMHMLVEYQTGQRVNIPLRLVMMSGDWIPIDLPARIKQLWHNITLMSLGGATEASIWSIYYPIEQIDPHWTSVPYGKPLTNQTFHVLNQRLEPCPIWVAGELYIGGVGLALGYWRDPERSAASFITHPYTGERLYKTGDLGRYLPDGNIEFLGREDFQVKIRGHRIELGEIESQLLKHSQVKEAIVSAVGTNRHDKQLVAYIVPSAPQNTSTPHDDQAAYGLKQMQGVLTDPLERLQFKLKQPGLRQITSAPQAIDLPPAPTPNEAYIERQSYRQFEGDPLTLAQLGQLLACLSPRTYPDAVLPKYRYGSAGSLYPVQMYLYLKPDRVAGLAGFYYYQPVEHKLILISNAQIERNRYDGMNQTIFDQATFALFLVAELDAIEPMYGAMAREFCLLEAGYISQLLMMESPRYEVGLCPIGGMDFEPLRQPFGLTASQDMVHSFLGGAISAEQKQRLPLPTPAAHAMSLDAELKAFLSQKLPTYMVPNIYLTLDQLPLSANGKVDRQALPAPEMQQVVQEVVVLPTTELERQLAEIVQRVLNVSQISMTTNFFDLGADSLQLVQIYNEIKTTFKRDIAIADIFRGPTIQALDELLSRASTIITDSSAQTGTMPIADLNPEQIDLLVTNTDNLTKAERQAYSYPLSYGQQALWFIYQTAPDSPAYNMALLLELQGELQQVALQAALQKLINRHPALRTTISIVHEQPLQTVQPTGEVQWGSHKANPVTLDQAIKTVYEQPFDLTQGPVLRATLFRLSAQQHILLLTMHHIFGDASSLAILNDELFTFYQAEISGQVAALPSLVVSHAKFVRWENNHLSESTLAELAHYWQTKLIGEIPFLNLPTDHARPMIKSYQGASQRFSLSATLTQQLQQLAQQEQVTLFALLLTAFQLLLHRYTDQTKIWVGTPTSISRQQPKFAQLVGYLVNPVILQATFDSPSSSFRALLSQSNTTVLEAIEHSTYPFPELVKLLHPQRDLSQVPLLQTMFNFQPNSLSSQRVPGLTILPLELDQMEGQFDLTLSMSMGETLAGAFRYNSDLFAPETIERMAGHLQTLLAAIVINPDQPIATLPMLTEAEQQQILVEWNNTATDYPRDKCIHQLFEEQVERTPNNIAVIFEQEQLTYRELNQRANQLAHHLQSLGVRAEVLVGICVERSIEMVVGLLGILKAGGAYLPLDPTYPAERLAFMLQDANVPVLLSQRHLKESLPPTAAHLVWLDTDWEQIAAYSHENPVNPEIHGNNLAYVIYTSGSTGQPKGVMIQHKSLHNYLAHIIKHFKKERQFALVSTIAADLGNTILFGALGTGGCLHILSTECVSNSMVLVDYFSRYSIDYLKIVPSHLFALQTSSTSTFIWPRQLLILGGEASRMNWIENMATQYHYGSILNHYGPTEATIGVLTYQVTPDSLTHYYVNLPIGRPIANTQVYILDRHLQPIPIGVAGELHIGGAGLARGYLNRPELTAEKFIANPFGEGRLYKTGDLARYLPDGNIEFLGRIDHQVKIRGFRIELGEIEAVLRQHDAVQEAIVVAQTTENEQKQLVVYVVLSQTQNANSLRDYLKAKLPDYMVPSFFVVLEQFPLTPNGKIDRKALPAPEGAALATTAEFAPPQTPTEQLLSTIWAEVLGVAQVGRHDNFFELGGHSLLAMRLLSQIEQHFGQKIAVVTLFQKPTIAELASILSLGYPLQDDPIGLPLQLGEPLLPPYFCLPGGFASALHLFQLVRHLDSKQPVYGLQPPGVLPNTLPLNHMAELVAYFLPTLEKVQPTGPYLLGGHSSGGEIAFALAMALQQQGKAVPLVTIFDSKPPHTKTSDPIESLTDSQILVDVAALLDDILGPHFDLDQLTVLSETEQWHYMTQKFQQIQLFSPEESLAMIQRMVNTLRGLIQATTAYLPETKYQGQLVLFRASDPEPEQPDPFVVGWQAVCEQPIKVHYVPGNHNTLLLPPHVKVLGQLLQSYLEIEHKPLLGDKTQATS